MRYQGGKDRLSKYIIPILEDYRLSDQVYLEPFVGGGSVLSRMSGRRIASDIHYPLIAMYRALQQGWNPPSAVSKGEYEDAQQQSHKYAAHELAFIGYGCSWGGKWFGGYASGEQRNYSNESRQNLLSMDLSSVDLLCGPYWMYRPENMLIYCDPPYEESTKYKSAEQFDHLRFWLTMRWWAQDNVVFVSERVKVPTDVAELVWEIPHTGGIRSNNEKPTEKLYRVKPLCVVI